MEKLFYFSTPKEDLKIQMLYRNEEELEKIRALSPSAATLPDVDEFYTTIQFPAAPEDRPYSFSSIVLSSDGKMAYQDNRAGPLIAKNNFLDPTGSLGDFWVLNLLRAMSDGTLVGAGTLANEPGVSCHVYDEDLARQRKEVLGKPYHPAGVVLSLDGTDIPLDHFSFQIDPAEEYKMLIATSPSGMEHLKKTSALTHEYWGPFQSCEEVDAFDFGPLYRDFGVFPVIATGQGAMPDAELLLYILRKIGMERICVESPSYCTHLLHREMLDEYFINYSMVFAGGGATPGYNSAFGYMQHPHARLLSVGIHHSNFLFTRQQLHYGVSCQADLTGYKY